MKFVVEKDSIRMTGSAREGWWLSGVKGGDVKLPRTRGCVTVWDALEAAEAWLAPELEAMREDEGTNENDE